MKPFAIGLGLALFLCTGVWAQSGSADTIEAPGTTTYTFQTINYPGDTFTQLLGINNSGKIGVI